MNDEKNDGWGRGENDPHTDQTAAPFFCSSVPPSKDVTHSSPPIANPLEPASLSPIPPPGRRQPLHKKTGKKTNQSTGGGWGGRKGTSAPGGGGCSPKNHKESVCHCFFPNVCENMIESSNTYPMGEGEQGEIDAQTK